jgi:hypothetical protein
VPTDPAQHIINVHSTNAAGVAAKNINTDGTGSHPSRALMRTFDFRRPRGAGRVTRRPVHVSQQSAADAIAIIHIPLTPAGNARVSRAEAAAPHVTKRVGTASLNATKPAVRNATGHGITRGRATSATRSARIFLLTARCCFRPGARALTYAGFEEAKMAEQYSPPSK